MNSSGKLSGYLRRELFKAIVIAVPCTLLVLYAAPRIFVWIGNWLMSRGLSLNAYLGLGVMVLVACVFLVAYACVRAVRDVADTTAANRGAGMADSVDSK